MYSRFPGWNPADPVHCSVLIRVIFPWPQDAGVHLGRPPMHFGYTGCKSSSLRTGWI